MKDDPLPLTTPDFFQPLRTRANTENMFTSCSSNNSPSKLGLQSGKSIHNDPPHPPGNNLWNTAVLVVNTLEREGLPSAIGGALAYGVHGHPRMTRDADLNTFVRCDDESNLAKLISTMKDLGASLAPGLSEEQMIQKAKDGNCFTFHLNDHKIEIFTNTVPFSLFDEAMKKRIRVSGTYVLSAESITIFKLLFNRQQDLLDVEKIIIRNQKQLDVAYIRHSLIEILGEGAEQVKWWDKAIQTLKHPSTDTLS